MEERQETPSPDEICVRNYQQEMLEASLTENIIVAQDTGSGKTHIAILRIRIECDRELRKVPSGFSNLFPSSYFNRSHGFWLPLSLFVNNSVTLSLKLSLVRWV